MTELVTLAEAASYLGVSKSTLRNWDKEGKLKAHRHPLNQYRAYDLDDLRLLRSQASPLDKLENSVIKSSSSQVSDPRSVKRVVARLHSILRNTDGDSSIIQRFDELTKLLFLKLVADRENDLLFTVMPRESIKAYAKRIRAAYASQASIYPHIITKKFARLTCSDTAISQCGTVFMEISFSSINFDVKGVAYEEVIRGTFDKSDHQQFFTPHQVVSFMVEMLQPFLKGVIADPACGTAGFLAEVVRSKIPTKTLIGLEIDERLAWVSGINLLLHGSNKFDIRCLTEGGTLGPQAKSLFGKVDAILTNPPFGSEFTDATALHTFELGKGRQSRRRGILFIERCWSLLKEGGVLGIIIDEGVLNLSSAVDVRQFIVKRFDILSIVSLPESAFMPYANVNASILLLRKSSAANRSRNVFFARAENIGRKANGDDDVLYDDTGNARPNSDLPIILERWRAVLANRNNGDNELAFVANVSNNLSENDSLRLDFRYHHPSRIHSRELLKRSKQPLHTLADICEERNETVITSTEMADQVILYTGLANIEVGNGIVHQVLTPAASLKSAVKRYEPNDIVFARMRPNLRKVALMAFSDGGYVSPECSVLSVRKDANGQAVVDPEVLAAVLRSDMVFGQIMHLIAGIGRPRLNTTDLRRIQIPIPPNNMQQEAKADFKGRLASSHQLRAKAQALLEEAQALEVSAVDEIAKRMIEG